MNRKSGVSIFLGGYWGKILLLSMMLFFVYLGDGILSDWVPSFVQSSLNSSFLMGLVMSFSSIVGFSADLIFPQLLKTVKTKKLMMMAIGASLTFSGILLWTTVWPWIVLFLMAMAVWGVYYEFLGFGSQEFVSGTVPITARSGAWAIMSVFKSLAYFLGPIIGSYVALTRGNTQTILTAVFFVMVGYVIWIFWGRSGKETEPTGKTERVNISSEIKRWITLSEHVWPVLMISIVMGLIDATFWTTGTVLSDSLAKQNFLGGMFLPFYMLPMVVVGVIVAKWGIYKGKKKMAERFMLLAGILLSFMGIVNSIFLLLAISFLVGTALSIAWPLTDAVYTDIIERMGKEGKHMVGLSGSTVSLSYILGPIMAGVIAQLLGERITFSVMGILMTLVALYLLWVTPKKLKLPQSEIKSWVLE